jgi:hypothetical protein
MTRRRQYVVVWQGAVVSRFDDRNEANRQAEAYGPGARVGYREFNPATRVWSEVRYLR